MLSVVLNHKGTVLSSVISLVFLVLHLSLCHYVCLLFLCKLVICLQRKARPWKLVRFQCVALSLWNIKATGWRGSSTYWFIKPTHQSPPPPHPSRCFFLTGAPEEYWLRGVTVWGISCFSSRSHYSQGVEPFQSSTPGNTTYYNLFELYED